MLWKFLRVCSLLLGAAVAGLGCNSTAPTTSAQNPQDQPELVQPKPKRVAHTPWHYKGVVTAVGVDWVEIGAGWQGSVETELSGRVTVRENGDTKKPKRISATGTKLAGNPDGEGDKETHHVSDLKVGDVVRIDSYADRAGNEWTWCIWIHRRPGGKIPPMHGETIFPGRGPTNHLRYQAEQDWEEKGIPIPKRFLSGGQAPWTNPPYPPVAPLPREVKP